MLPFSTQRVINPDAPEKKKNGINGTTSRRQEIAPRFHQKITSKAKGSVTMAVLLSNPREKEAEGQRVTPSASALVKP